MQNMHSITRRKPLSTKLRNVDNFYFREIIKLQFEKEPHTLLCILKLFTNIIHELSLKNAWLPPIFFSDFNNTC